MSRVGLISTALVAWMAVAAAAQEYGAGFARFLGYNEDRARYSDTEQLGDRAPFLWRQEAEVSETVYRSTTTSWAVNGRAGELALGSPAVVLPQNGALVPQKLWNASAGAGYTRELGERSRWGATASFGSASDRLFLSWREDQVLASVYYQMPSLDHNSWIFLLNYSNNRPFANNVPLPGVAYVIDAPAHQLNAIIGFPFAFVRWKPQPEWTFSAGLFGGASYFLEASRRIDQRVSAFARFERTPLQWLRAGRSSDTDRLIFDSKSALAGIRAALGRRFSLEASAGRAFDRRFFEARDAGHSGGVTRAALSNATVLQSSLTWRWGGV